MARGRRNPPQGEVGGEGLDAAVEFRRAIKAEQDRDNIPLAEAYQLFVDNGPEDTILGMEQNTICSTTGAKDGMGAAARTTVLLCCPPPERPGGSPVPGARPGSGGGG